MPLADYNALRVAQEERIQQLTDDYRDKVRARIAEVLNDPNQRDPEVGMYLVGYLTERMADEINPDVAIQYWYTVLSDAAEMSWDELNNIPQPKRGDVWTTTRKVMFSWAQIQAQIDTGFWAAVCQANADKFNKYMSVVENLKTADKTAMAEQGVARG